MTGYFNINNKLIDKTIIICIICFIPYIYLGWGPIGGWIYTEIIIEGCSSVFKILEFIKPDILMGMVMMLVALAVLVLFFVGFYLIICALLFGLVVGCSRLFKRV